MPADLRHQKEISQRRATATYLEEEGQAQASETPWPTESVANQLIENYLGNRPAWSGSDLQN